MQQKITIIWCTNHYIQLNNSRLQKINKHTLQSKTSRGNFDLNCSISQFSVPSLRLQLTQFTKMLLYLGKENITPSKEKKSWFSPLENFTGDQLAHHMSLHISHTNPI